MYFKIKKRIDNELARFARRMDSAHSLGSISPLLSREIKNFMLRKGKRLRPVLFVAGYLGFARKPAPNIYKSALSLELLHDFLIIHDDIIDKSDTRRGKPSLHRRFDAYLAGYKNTKFRGEDLSIVAGDIMYAIATHAFLSVKEEPLRKERALKNMLAAAINTGIGEFVELMHSLKNLKNMKKKDIYRIYDLKTAYYSFASPLSTGAILGGASRRDIAKLSRSGMCLGRAFQIKDDILGIFGEEDDTGKSPLTDLQEAKKTILIWHAYKHAGKKERKFIKAILSKPRVTRPDLLKMRKIVITSGALDYAKREVSLLAKKAKRFLEASKMKPVYKDLLTKYHDKLLKL